MKIELTLGDQELAILRFVAAHAPATAGEVSTGYGEPNGLARSTIETVLERLRKKGFLTRERLDGVFRYGPTVAQSELLGGLVGQFVERTLNGSLLPFVTYFSHQNRLSESELIELERLVAKLEKRPSGDES
jgi:predicted transcriptional regulator